MSCTSAPMAASMTEDASALIDAEGEIVARSTATWIALED